MVAPVSYSAAYFYLLPPHPEENFISFIERGDELQALALLQAGLYISPDVLGKALVIAARSNLQEVALKILDRRPLLDSYYVSCALIAASEREFESIVLAILKEVGFSIPLNAIGVVLNNLIFYKKNSVLLVRVLLEHPSSNGILRNEFYLVLGAVVSFVKALRFRRNLSEEDRVLFRMRYELLCLLESNAHRFLEIDDLPWLDAIGLI